VRCPIDLDEPPARQEFGGGAADMRRRPSAVGVGEGREHQSEWA
jgi:hypothetical protein